MDLDASFIAGFIKDNFGNAGMSLEKANTLKSLVDKYKVDALDIETANQYSVISVSFGKLGSLVTRRIQSIENPIELSYEEGSSDFLCIKCKTDKILWTDFEETEPYNRQSGLYCDGASWNGLELVKTHSEYREFESTEKYKDFISNLSFGISGFHYNDYWKSVRFGLVIGNESVNEFISTFRNVVGKNK